MSNAAVGPNETVIPIDAPLSILPAAEPVTATVTEPAPPAASEPINIVEPPSRFKVDAVFEPLPPPPPLPEQENRPRGLTQPDQFLPSDQVELIRKLMEERNAPIPEPPPPPPPTARQWSQTEREQEAGRARVARAEEQQRLRPPPPARLPSEGTSTPVFRPDAYMHETKVGGK